MIHWTPVAERVRSSWIVGIAIATIVWSMKVIETAKIIAARISLLFGAEDWFMRAALPCGRRILPAFGYSRRRNAADLLARIRNRRRLRSRRRDLRRPLADREPRQRRPDGGLPRGDERFSALGLGPRHFLAPTLD